MGVFPTSLNIQYRMHQGLLDFPNSTFYEGIIRPGVQDSARTLELKMQTSGGVARLIKPNFPSLFISTNGKEEQNLATKSY